MSIGHWADAPVLYPTTTLDEVDTEDWQMVQLKCFAHYFMQ